MWAASAFWFLCTFSISTRVIKSESPGHRESFVFWEDSTTSSQYTQEGCAGWFYISFTQERAIREEELSTEKLSPSGWPIGKSVVHMCFTTWVLYVCMHMCVGGHTCWLLYERLFLGRHKTHTCLLTPEREPMIDKSNSSINVLSDSIFLAPSKPIGPLSYTRSTVDSNIVQHLRLVRVHDRNK